MPYENLPQSTQQPVPVISAVTPSSYSDLPSTNPFSPNFTPPSAASTTQAPFSPVSPLVEKPIERLSHAPLRAPKPQRPDATHRRSVDLRRLDGKPYPSSNSEKPPKAVKVAKDMHDGALPPVYKRQASDPINPAAISPPLSNTAECGKCGRTGVEEHGHRHGHNCNHCGKRKSSAPATTVATVTTPAAAHARATSSGEASHGSRPSESTVGSSGSPASSTGNRCCTKCGRHKRPHSTPMPQVPFNQRPNGFGPATAPMPMANHPAMRIQSAGLSIRPNMPANNPVYPQIDVIPPSASTYKPVNSPFSTYGDDSPLVGKATKQEFKLFRHSSLARSLSRRLSRKDKTATSPLPSQQLQKNQSGEQSAGRLINMISSAMQAPPSDRDAQYAKLGGGDEPDRPQTPFSFVGGEDERDAFEMVDLRDQGSVSGHSYEEVTEPEITVTRSEGDYSGIQQDTIDVIPRPKSTEPRQYLTVDEADRPQITRFKSLRQGVSRMNSISRTTSLKRLGSLKTVHHNWYRDDMAIEGASGDNFVPVY